MATVKLTKHIREEIRNDLLRHRFGGEFRELVHENKLMAAAMLQHVVSEAVLKKAATLEPGWLPTVSIFRVQIAGRYEEIHLSGGGFYGDILQARPKNFEWDRVAIPVPAKFSSHSAIGVLRRGGTEAEEKMINWFERVDNQRADLSKRVAEAKRIADATLAKASTLNRLRELWPEVAPFTKRWEDSAPALPAIQTEVLNKHFALPVEEAA